ncbi:MAG: response regulator [Candidatus Hodarchaeales archaeon]|jgi:PAS domain S-box-containing protein
MNQMTNMKKKNILLIEDNETHVRLIERFFESRRSYSLTHTSDAREAIKHLENGGLFDVILLDYSLPDYSGIDFLKTLNKTIIGKKPPVIMITGHGDENIAVEAMKLGAMDYVVKSRNWLNALPTKIAHALVFRELAQEVEELRALSQAVLNNSFDSIIVTDLSGLILLPNPSLIDLTGFSQEEYLNGMQLTKIFVNEDLAKQVLESAKNGNKIRNLKTRIISKHGPHVPVAVSSGPMQDQVLIVITDLRVEEELSEEIKLFRKFSADHIFVNVFKVGNFGPEVVLAEEGPFEEEVLHKMAIFYSVSLGQGDNEHQGLFGPLPIPDRPEDEESNKYLSLIYSFSVNDPSNLDPRAKGRSFSFLSVTMPESLIEIYSNRKALSEKLESIVNEIDSIEQVNHDFLKKIKEQVINLNLQ